MFKSVFVLLAAVAFVSTGAVAQSQQQDQCQQQVDQCPPQPVQKCTTARPRLIAAADRLLVDFEKFDEALHAVEAPEKMIGLVHHFEEGLLELIENVKSGVTCTDAIAEFQHFHEDIQLTYQALKARPDIFYIDSVLNSWNRLLPSFVYFQNVLYYNH